MATLNFLGRALPVAKVMTFTPALVNVGDTFTVTCNGKSITFTSVGAGTVAEVTAGLTALLAASTIPEFTEATYVDSTTHITATGVYAGEDFTFTSSSVGGTLTAATTTAASGPAFWDNVNNWDTGAIPANGDTVNYDKSRGSIKAGLDQNAVTLAALRVYSAQSTSNELGLPDVNTRGGYTEYRERELKISVTALEVNDFSPRTRINTGTNVTTATVVNTGTGAESGVPSVLLSGSHANNVYHCQSGEIGLAFYDYQTLQALTVNVNPLAQVRTGQGATIATMNNKGAVEGDATLTTYNQYDQATAILRGAFNVTTLNHRGGFLDLRIRGTFTTVQLAGRMTMENDQAAKTFTNTTFYPGADLNDPGDVITFTNGVQMDSTAKNLRAA